MIEQADNVTPALKAQWVSGWEYIVVPFSLKFGIVNYQIHLGVVFLHSSIIEDRK